jgi:xanthine/uracil permease
MQLTKYSGYILCATAILHTAVGLILGWSTLADMHQSGWFNSTIIQGEIHFQREAIIWFLITGFFWMTLGLTLQTAINQGFSLPSQLGWSFTMIGIGLAYIMPESGAYLFIIQGGLILCENAKLSTKISAKAT